VVPEKIPDLVYISLHPIKLNNKRDCKTRPCFFLSDLLDQALFLQESYGLLTNDSVIAAVALRLDADAWFPQTQGSKS
jgi:predicted nucleic acid-binding protein